MNKEQLETKIAELNALEQQLCAQLNSIVGARGVWELLLSELDMPELTLVTDEVVEPEGGAA